VGGQQQRVALARALVFRPDVLLLDEPLSNLDAKLRQEVRVEIRELQKRLGLTTVMVTHDQEEALTMADRLVVMNDGAVRQVGTQEDLYERPTDRFVAGFVGRSTFIEGQIESPGRFRSEGGLALVCSGAVAGAATLALRPERIIPAERRPHGTTAFPAGGIHLLSRRNDRHARAHLAQGARRGADPEPSCSLSPKVGRQVDVAWPATNGIVFSGDGT
jgi:putative spermidine/putrescine transport system ATP-binding protein